MSAKRKSSAIIQHKENIMSSTPEPAEIQEIEDSYPGSIAKDAEKLKLMLLAWNYSQSQGGNRNGDMNPLGAVGSLPGGIPPGLMSDLPQIPGMNPEDVAGFWANYHSALQQSGLNKGSPLLAGGLVKPTTPPTQRDQNSPNLTETGSTHDETSSSGNKEDEDDDDDESDERIDTHSHHDPERLKAFNMFVRLFVDENLDRMVPISKQPKEKIQAIIDSCTRQFPEFAERARKRIRTYLKSCRRNKRSRDPNTPWDASRPTPAHLTSVQAEQILASACENESMNAKRMRMGMDPISQPMPISISSSTTDTTASTNAMNRISNNGGLDFSTKLGSDNPLGPSAMDIGGNPSITPFTSSINIMGNNSQVASLSKNLNNLSNGGMPLIADQKTLNNLASGNLATTVATINGLAAAINSAAMYRPNFTQAFQRSANSGQVFNPISAGNSGTFPGQPQFSLASGGSNQMPPVTSSGSQSSGIPNGATDLSINKTTNCTNTNQLANNNHSTNNSSTNTGGNGSTNLSGNPPASQTSQNQPQKPPLLTHKLNAGEITAVRQLITGYRESAAFLLRSADELEQLLLQQQPLIPPPPPNLTGPPQ